LSDLKKKLQEIQQRANQEIKSSFDQERIFKELASSAAINRRIVQLPIRRMIEFIRDPAFRAQQQQNYLGVLLAFHELMKDDGLAVAVVSEKGVPDREIVVSIDWIDDPKKDAAKAAAPTSAPASEAPASEMAPESQAPYTIASNSRFDEDEYFSAG
jgi:hypothetical protein